LHLIYIATGVLVILFAVISCVWVKELYYAHEAKSSFSNQLTNLRDPLNTFGFNGITSEHAKCLNESVYLYNTKQLQCTSSYDAYVVIGTSQVAKNNFVAKAAELDQLLKKYGWTETANATPNIADWFQGITSGKDWLPDEGAYRNVGKTSCALDFMLAFSNPKPPAFNLQMACSSPRLTKLANEMIF